MIGSFITMSILVLILSTYPNVAFSPFFCAVPKFYQHILMLKATCLNLKHLLIFPWALADY